MQHTPQIKKAIQFAARKHHGQMRVAAGPLPYVTHLFSVALLVAEDGAHDDVVTAALLHDTIEDTETTRTEIIDAFNSRVADLIEAVSEQKELPWKERKQAYIDALQHADEDALIIAIADKVDNIESKIEEYEREGDAFLANWKRTPADYAWFHAGVLAIALMRLPEHSLTKRFVEAHAREKSVFA